MSVRVALGCWLILLPAITLAGGADRNLPSLRLELPQDSPILLRAFTVATSPQSERGVPAAERFEASVRLHNSGPKTVVGLAFSIRYEPVGDLPTASYVISGLRAAPESEFPIHLAFETAHGGRVSVNSPATVYVALDCVLFSDLSTYGPDRLNQHSNLVVYELQGRRERAYVAGLLKAQRLPDVREELNFGLPPEPPAWILSVEPPPPFSHPQSLGIQALSENAPVTIVGGTIQALGGRFWSPMVEVRRAGGTNEPVSVDVAFILADERGREAVAAILPFPLSGSPGATIALQSNISARAAALDSVPVLVRKCYAFVSAVHLSDGSVWVPSRSDLERASDGSLLTALSACPERERLAAIFRHGGLQAVASDLKRFE